ncbi:cell filamentation protein Fic [Acetobacterium paludosum]|uniref:Cell filamentation protein Fic n=1 Tax=Acetobacterium paludosum TaxID=52693 RepID=A0A923HXC5_9FIRM|nr:Fic family protein [Acetobacterium paludosum]MBC3888910.1 cell filamentation protein Fic [Acetobacterium paludosum]
MREFNYNRIPKELLNTETINMVSAIHEYKGKQELFIEIKPDILNHLLEIAKVQSTGASNRIEGIYTTDERLIEIVQKKSEPRNRSEAEIAGYREVLSIIHESFEYIPLSPNIILQLHKMLYSFHPTTDGGNWKNNDNVITEIDLSGNKSIRFRPLSAFETPNSMEKLCIAYQEAFEKKEIDPLILIPMFILDFLCIHPFNDGNGRMSRLLTLLLLYQSGYIVGKYISLEMIVEKSKETYYEALKDSSDDWLAGQNTYLPFFRYYLGCILNSYKEFSEHVHYPNKKGITKGERIRLVFEKHIGTLNKKEISEKLPGISQAMIEKTLSDLVKEGYIKKIGSGRNTTYSRTLNKSGR